MAVHVHRVTVRGFFDALDDDRRGALLAAQPEHDAMDARFTADGTLTYGRDVAGFSFRYEVRTTDDDDPDRNGAAARIGLERAVATLDRMGVGHKRLRASATDMADVWRDR